MRAHIPFLDTNALDWREVAPGLFSKLLSRDDETGARTALNRMVPELGMKPPGGPHYHHTAEELFVVKGRFSFDSRTWLTPFSYCFHPPETVHGFKSNVPEETWFLSRIGRELDFNWVTNPTSNSAYYVSETPPERSVVYIQNPRVDGWEDLEDSNGKVNAKHRMLSEHPSTFEGSKLLQLKPGWQSASRLLHSYQETYVIEGLIEGDDGTQFTKACYAFFPPGTERPGLRSPNGALLYVNYGGINST